ILPPEERVHRAIEFTREYAKEKSFELDEDEAYTIARAPDVSPIRPTAANNVSADNNQKQVAQEQKEDRDAIAPAADVETDTIPGYAVAAEENNQYSGPPAPQAILDNTKLKLPKESTNNMVLDKKPMVAEPISIDVSDGTKLNEPRRLERQNSSHNSLSPFVDLTAESIVSVPSTSIIITQHVFKASSNLLAAISTEIGHLGLTSVHSLRPSTPSADKEKWLKYISDLPPTTFTPTFQRMLLYYLNILQREHAQLAPPPESIRKAVDELKSAVRKDEIVGGQQVKFEQLDKKEGMVWRLIEEMQKVFSVAFESDATPPGSVHNPVDHQAWHKLFSTTYIPSCSEKTRIGHVLESYLEGLRSRNAPEDAKVPNLKIRELVFELTELFQAPKSADEW
ncbi:hypothetical protein HDV05_007602, partial [Chytridiales sp. JEL 0842]